MFNVIIADLEQSHTLGIKSYIDTNFLQFKVKKTFSNEKDFYKYIKNHSIDLIIMEIRFLGIEFFKKMKEIISLYKNIRLALPYFLSSIISTLNSDIFSIILFLLPVSIIIIDPLCINSFSNINFTASIA